MLLVVIDTQEQIVNERLFEYDTFIVNVKRLLKEARENGIEVVFIRHDDGENELLHKGNEGYEIASVFAPIKDEKVFDKKVNSAFKQSGLHEYLKQKEERQLILVGLQTDYCMDANVKCGFEHGYEIIVPAFANSTCDNAYMSAAQTYHYYNDFMWKDRYAKCISVEETVQLMHSENKK